MNNIDKFKDLKVLVIGDMMIDKYIIGTVSRISPEAPVPVLNQREIRRKLGGCGNVILNVCSLGAKVRAVGRIGDDAEGEFFREQMKKTGVDDRFIFSDGSTIVKTRVSANNQQFIRIDEEDITPPSEGIMSDIRDNVTELMKDIDVVIISDYSKGFISEELAALIIFAARERNIPVLADPKGKSAAKYRGAFAITPNTKEFLDMTGLTSLPDENGIREAGIALCEENDLEYLIFTRSEKGISIIDRKAGTKSDFSAVVKEVVDVTGAGDTVAAVCALCIGSGFSMAHCAVISNLAASVVVSRFGTAQVSFAELAAECSGEENTCYSPGEVLEQIEARRREGKRIVFTNGCFDIVHAGHISSFRQARKFGDVLVVGLNSDESIKRIKGEKRPIVALENRMTMLSALDCVDYVIPFEDDTPQKLIEQVRPDVLVKGKDWEGKPVAGDSFVRSYGGEVRFIELEQGLSTTSIIEKIKISME